MPEEIIHHDKDGNEYVLDEAGNHRPPMKTKKIVGEKSGWVEYDSSQGHCGLCGSLVCRGQCFR
jgi:hypothetical protein